MNHFKGTIYHKKENLKERNSCFLYLFRDIVEYIIFLFCPRWLGWHWQGSKIPYTKGGEISEVFSLENSICHNSQAIFLSKNYRNQSPMTLTEFLNNVFYIFGLYQNSSTTVVSLVKKILQTRGSHPAVHTDLCL